jgi:hypothetical protein
MAAQQPHFSYWGGGGVGFWHELPPTNNLKTPKTKNFNIIFSHNEVFVIFSTKRHT